MEEFYNHGNIFQLKDRSLPFKSWAATEDDPDISPGEAVSKYGFEFIWTHNHMKGKELNHWRKLTDDPCDNVLKLLPNKPNQDTLDQVLSLAKTEGGVYQEFVDAVTTVPKWVDWERIRRGQQVFIRNGPGAGMALMYLSLAGGFGAPKINKVLTATGYLGNKHTMRRLLETNQMIIDCMQADGLVPGKGIGWFSALRVRFLHGKVRQRLGASQRWNAEEWGQPINQEDTIATLLSFSFNVVLALGIMGIYLSQEEVDDYLHLWRYIGYLSGVREELNPLTDFPRARAVAESTVLHLIDPDESSIYLSHHSIESLMDEKNPIRWTLPAHFQLARMLMGDHLADLLKIPSSTFYKYHHLAFFAVLRQISRMSYLPVVGPVFVEMNRVYLTEFPVKGLGGKRATFSMSHSPTNESIDNLQALKDEKARSPLVMGKGKAATILRVVFVIALLIFLQKWFGASFLPTFLKRRR